MITTTLNDIRSHSPCRDRWEHLLKGLGKNKADDEPLPLERILEINGIEDALWALRAVKAHDDAIKLFKCSRQIKWIDTLGDVAALLLLATAFSFFPSVFAGVTRWWTAAAIVVGTAGVSVFAVSDKLNFEFIREFIRLCRLEGKYGAMDVVCQQGKQQEQQGQ